MRTPAPGQNLDMAFVNLRAGLLQGLAAGYHEAESALEVLSVMRAEPPTDSMLKAEAEGYANVMLLDLLTERLRMAMLTLS